MKEKRNPNFKLLQVLVTRSAAMYSQHATLSQGMTGKPIVFASLGNAYPGGKNVKNDRWNGKQLAMKPPIRPGGCFDGMFKKGE